MGSRSPRGLVPLLLGLLAWAIGMAPGRGQAQHTPDPYNIVGEFNSQYEPYMFAREPGPDSLIPNQNRLNSRAGFRSANRFQSYINDVDSLDGEVDTGANFRRSGAGTRYFDAYRKYDEGLGRVYRPNQKADEAYYNDLDERNQKYFEARQEKDPKKRAQLLREYNLEKLRAARTLSASRSATFETGRPARGSRSTSVDQDGEELFDRAPRRNNAGPGATPGRSSSGRDSAGSLPPLRSPGSSVDDGLPALRSPASSRSSAPSPPSSRTSAGGGLSSRTPAARSSSGTGTPSPSRVLERNDRFDLPRLRPPSSRTAPPPPR